MPTVDIHAHIFPPLDQACGFADAQTHRLYQQYSMHLHGNQPPRRRADHRIVADKGLWDPDDYSAAGRRDVRFRVGRYGRFEWEVEGEGRYIQFLPPSLQDMAASADFMVAQMDYAGIDVAVLQNDAIYGNLAAYFADAIKAHPDRFIGLARVDEAAAYRDDQLATLDEAVALGMKGLYFTTAGFFANSYREYYDAPPFAPFWDRVEKLNLPVFWVFYGTLPTGDMAAEMRRFLAFSETRPGLTSVLVHGLPTAQYADAKDRLNLPEDIDRLLKDLNVYAEILYPIAWGGKADYPYRRALDHTHQLIATYGPDRFLWGSDMPNIERYCTYAQSLSYLRDYADFLDAADLEKILGSNALKLFKQPPS